MQPEDFRFQSNQKDHLPIPGVLSQKIENALERNLGQNHLDLLFPEGTDGIVFGGAVRDILAGDPIQDIDIVCGPKSARKLENHLIQNGFVPDNKPGSPIEDIPQPTTPGNNQNYETPGPIPPTEHNQHERNNTFRFRSIPFVKHHFEADGKTPKISRVDIIRPNYDHMGYDEKATRAYLCEFIANVDIRSCAVGIDRNRDLLEFIPKAVKDCLYKRIRPLKDNKMHKPGRAQERIKKLQDRGWALFLPQKKKKIQLPTMS